MSTETHVSAQQSFDEAVNKGDFDAVETLVAPDSVDHDPAPGQEPGPAPGSVGRQRGHRPQVAAPAT